METMNTSCSADSFLSDPKVTLKDADLWNKFSALQNEMIITKRGRCMFPRLRFQITNLNPDSLYYLCIELVLPDKHKFKYTEKKGWITTDMSSDTSSQRKIYEHPNSPASGAFWMSQIVKFDKLKLTNTEVYACNNGITLRSHNKYLPKLILSEAGNQQKFEKTDFYISFAETNFIAVTAYQNKQIIDLKTDHNQYAKGLRGKQLKRKRVYFKDDDDYDKHNTDDEDIDVGTESDPLFEKCKPSHSDGIRESLPHSNHSISNLQQNLSLLSVNSFSTAPAMPAPFYPTPDGNLSTSQYPVEESGLRYLPYLNYSYYNQLNQFPDSVYNHYCFYPTIPSAFVTLPYPQPLYPITCSVPIPAVSSTSMHPLLPVAESSSTKNDLKIYENYQYPLYSQQKKPTDFSIESILRKNRDKNDKDINNNST